MTGSTPRREARVVAPGPHRGLTLRAVLGRLAVVRGRQRERRREQVRRDVFRPDGVVMMVMNWIGSVVHRPRSSSKRFRTAGHRADGGNRGQRHEDDHGGEANGPNVRTTRHQRSITPNIRGVARPAEVNRRAEGRQLRQYRKRVVSARLQPTSPYVAGRPLRSPDSPRRCDVADGEPMPPALRSARGTSRSTQAPASSPMPPVECPARPKTFCWPTAPPPEAPNPERRHTRRCNG